MNENKKTVILISIAVAVSLIAWFGKPREWSDAPRKALGEKLSADFDPLLAAAMEITEYDESTATVRPFKVAVVDINGNSPRWSIPSHNNYPADADKQVAVAATGLMGLQILSVEGDTQADHEKFGVVDPDPKTLKRGAAGVGMRVAIRDKNDKDLLSLIIGKAVPGRPELRYVRRTGQDPIYTAAVNTANLSTSFDHWIEKNLLKMNTMDLGRLWLRDYSSGLLMDEQGRVGIEKENRGEFVLNFNEKINSGWGLAEYRKVNKDGTFSPGKMADDEELDLVKLGELKTALDDLKIVDVAKKPEGISADLKASADFMKKNDAILTLASRGFIVALTEEGGTPEICSKEGEVRCLMKDGVEYVLRFGEIAADSDAAATKPDENAADKKEKTDAGKKASAGRNRYLFVMAEFNPELIAKPQLEPLPEIKPEDEKKPVGENAAKENEKDGKDAKKAAEKSPLEIKREQIDKENKRKQDEYDEKIAAGKKHAEELNARFADWYYIISDDVYKKIHLGHDDIIKNKDKKDANAGDGNALPADPASEFERFRQQGLDGN